jgi:hypothetical protein
MLNEIKLGLKPEKPVDIPDTLEIIQACRLMGIHRVNADYEHQPYIWTLEFRAVLQEEQLFAALHENSSKLGGSTSANN